MCRRICRSRGKSMSTVRKTVIRNSLVDQVYDLILEKVRNGDLQPGDRLNIEALSDEFGVSRTPMREAISRLTQNGYVEVKHNAGPRIAVLDPSKVRDISTANTIILEGLMDLFFEDKNSDVDRLCVDLEKIISGQEKALSDGDLASFSRLSVEFHEHLIQAYPNSTLQTFAMNTQMRLDMFVSSYQKDVSARRKSVTDHKHLVECLRSGDSKGFKAALREHNTSPINYFEEQIPESVY